LEDCLFCKIANGVIPCDKVYEDSYTLAFLDINPVSDGHTLVITKKHYKNIMEIPDDELSKLIISVGKVSKAVEKAMNADGINIIQNNNTAAGQAVPHIHFHIIPRHDSDGISICGHREKNPGDSKILAGKIIKSF
jgi:histidine triad (HIT) family protein